MASSAARSPSSTIRSSTSALACSNASSQRAGWMRPSAISRSRVRRATSRRMPSKLERRTAEGVSSTMMSTPVSCSSTWMLRPSRPMIRPFIASFGSCTSCVRASAPRADRRVAASRWRECARARRSASRRVSSSILRRARPAWRRASASTSSIRACRASAALSEAIRSSSARSPGLTFLQRRRRDGRDHARGHRANPDGAPLLELGIQRLQPVQQPDRALNRCRVKTSTTAC